MSDKEIQLLRPTINDKGVEKGITAIVAEKANSLEHSLKILGRTFNGVNDIVINEDDLCSNFTMTFWDESDIK